MVDAAAATRRALLEATLAPSAGYHPNSAPLLLAPAYPPAARARADHDLPLDPSSLAGGGAPSTWMRRMVGVGYTRPLKETDGPQAELHGAAAVAAVGAWQAGAGLRLDSDARGFWLLYDLLTGHLRLRVLGAAGGDGVCSGHGMGAVLLRLASPAGCEELTPLLRCLELLPHLASEMPRFKGDKSKGLADDVLRKGMKLFKKGDKGGKGLPDEVLAVLQRLLPSLGPAAAVAAAPLYVPPAGLPTRQMEELRASHRTWLAPRELGYEMASRKVPPPFAAEIQIESGEPISLVLAAIEPLRFAATGGKPPPPAPSATPSPVGSLMRRLSRGLSFTGGRDETGGAGGGGGGDGAARPVALAVESHPAAKSVVARKMLRRLKADSAWLAQRTAAGGGAAPRLTLAAHLNGSPRSLEALVGDLDNLIEALRTLDETEAAALDGRADALVDRASGGGRGAGAAARGARALALRAGSEPRVGIEVLCRLLMSSAGSAELRVLNPLLDAAEAEEVLSEATGLLLRVSRAAHLARALALARAMRTATTAAAAAAATSTRSSAAAASSASSSPTAAATGGGGHAGEAVLGELRVLADQLAAMLCTPRAHMHSGGGEGGEAKGVYLDPRLLVFEYTTGFVLRATQVRLVRELAGAARAGRSVCQQMLMGEGKTTVISPLLALLLGESNLVLQIVPSQLLAFALSVLRGVFGAGPLRKPVWTFAFDRRTAMTEALLDKAQVARAERAVMVTTPASVKACMLKLLELLHLVETGAYSRNLRRHSKRDKVARLLRLQRKPSAARLPQQGLYDKGALTAQAAWAVQLLGVWRGAYAVIDEVDMVFHPLRSELNWPLGDKYALDFAPHRWQLPMTLLEAMLA